MDRTLNSSIRTIRTLLRDRIVSYLFVPTCCLWIAAARRRISSAIQPYHLYHHISRDCNSSLIFARWRTGAGCAPLRHHVSRRTLASSGCSAASRNIARIHLVTTSPYGRRKRARMPSPVRLFALAFEKERRLCARANISRGRKSERGARRAAARCWRRLCLVTRAPKRVL